jgi:hypothetical protein
MKKSTHRHRRFFALLGALLSTAVGLTARAEDARPIDGITDNSFLIEEAYNQDPGVVQHIFTAVYSEDNDNDPQRRGWSFGFTQEWPIFSQRHQFSYTIPFSFTREERDHQDGVEDILLNYRLQALEEGERLPAFAPRFSLILPTGSRDEGTGNGVVGFQWNLPFSKRIGPRLATHANLGLTYLPDTRVVVEGEGEGGNPTRRLSPKHSLVSYNLGVSSIFALSSRFHLMLEWVGNFDESLNDAGKAEHDFTAVISPGVRAAVINRDNLQVVLGVAVPVGLTRPTDNYGVFIYLSLEHDFL